MLKEFLQKLQKACKGSQFLRTHLDQRLNQTIFRDNAFDASDQENAIKHASKKPKKELTEMLGEVETRIKIMKKLKINSEEKLGEFQDNLNLAIEKATKPKNKKAGRRNKGGAKGFKRNESKRYSGRGVSIGGG